MSPSLLTSQTSTQSLHSSAPSSQGPNMSLAQNEDFLKAAFRGYDKNGDGRVTREEFKRVMLRTRSA